MKLLLQSDDYGITRAAARGIVYGIEHGIIRNTGLFANMPWAEECVEWIRPCLDKIAFGLDLNLTTGAPLLPPEAIPTLVEENGRFLSSWESRRRDAALGHDHASMDEVARELDAQIQKFIELVGKKPDYLHVHAYETPAIHAVHQALAQRYGVPYCSDVMERLVGYGVPDYRIGWYLHPGTAENQLNSSLKAYILEHSEELLAQEYCFLIGHMGYVDRELMDLSTYNLYRLNDLDAVTCPEILGWVQKNRVELITYKNL